jgi:hypothetical protein
MGRRRRTRFGDVTTTRPAFDGSETRCPSCRRPIGPQDKPTFVRGLSGGEPRLATLRCGRCTAMLTVRFEDEPVAGA